MNPNSSLAQNCVIPAQAGIQQGETSREYPATWLALFASLVEWLVVPSADKTTMLPRFAGDFLIIWIPACAGMTG